MDSYGNVEVQAPKGTPVEYLVQLLEEKWDWIQTTRKEMAERAREYRKRITIKEKAFVFRNTYPIQISQDVSIEQDNAIFEGISYIFM